MNGIPRLLLIGATLAAAGADWTRFRGDSSSSALRETLPTSWSKADGKNIAWEAPLPGKGVAGAIVVGDNVIVTASDGPRESRLHVLCFDAATGKKRWSRQFWATGRTLCHPTSAVAANTPVSDGQRIYAFFSSNDLICLDLQGNLVWFRGLTHDYPAAGNDVGMASSPLLVRDTVVVQIECQGESFACGLDKTTGEDRWRIPRPAEANWSSPVALRGGAGLDQIVVLPSGKGLTALDADTGAELWSNKAPGDSIASPVSDGQTLWSPGNGVRMLKTSAGTAPPTVAWANNKLSPGAASPVLHDKKLYVINRAGVLSCADAETGELKWQLRLKGAFWSTPVAAGDYLYAANQDGDVQVVRLGDQGELVATNTLGESLMGSAAVANGAIYYRSHGHLWKIAETK